MSKLIPLPQKKVIQILLQNGFHEVRAAKHITFKKKAENGKIFTTWVPHHREVTVCVIRYIIKQTEKPREEFEI